MEQKKINLTYVFGAGREKKINNAAVQAKEFFYGYFSLLKTFDISIVEMDFPNKSKSKIMYYYDKILRKLTKFPIYSKDILSSSNRKILKNSDILILTTDLLALSLLPYLLVLKLRKRAKCFVIVMGLFGRTSDKKIIKLFQNFYLFLLDITVSKYIFLGEGELNNAKDLNRKISSKFQFLPFSVDTKFWNPQEDFNLSSRKNILFIGNDGKRDYDLLKDIAKSLPDLNFVFITSQINETDLNNVKLVNGNWGENILTDEEVKDYYVNSRLTIIPLKESLQPSGQSVALQSMSCGTPVIISKTEGFWDNKKFIHNKNIIFEVENKLEFWVKTIKDVYLNEKLLTSLSNEGVNTIHTNFNLDIFNSRLKNIIEE